MKVRVGAPDPSLAEVSGIAAVGPIKQRARGYSARQLLVGLDRHRADTAGQALTPVAGVCSTTAGGWPTTAKGSAAGARRWRPGPRWVWRWPRRPTYPRLPPGHQLRNEVLALPPTRKHQPRNAKKINIPSWRSTHRAIRGFEPEGGVTPLENSAPLIAMHTGDWPLSSATRKVVEGGPGKIGSHHPGSNTLECITRAGRFTATKTAHA